MKSLGFDPGAIYSTSSAISGKIDSGLIEATLDRVANGRLILSLFEDDGALVATLDLREDFLDALIAARTREAAA